jgi:hypothetical protein
MATIKKRSNQDGTVTYGVKIRRTGHPTRIATFRRYADAGVWAQWIEIATFHRIMWWSSDALCDPFAIVQSYPHRCLTDKVYLPTIVQGRVSWHLGYTTEASAAAFTQSYQAFQRAASQQEPSYRVRGSLADGFDSTTKSIRTLFPGARLGNCLRHALNKLPGKLTAIATPVRKALHSKFHTLLPRARQRKGLWVFALGQR